MRLLGFVQSQEVTVSRTVRLKSQAVSMSVTTLHDVRVGEAVRAQDAEIAAQRCHGDDEVLVKVHDVNCHAHRHIRWE